MLVPATGRIVVVLENAAPSGYYKVSYLHPTNSGDYQQLALEAGSELAIDHIPKRRYRVMVQGSENGPIAQADADLSLTKGEARVVVDVSKLKPCK